jgi:hypothetical protein
MTTKTYSITDVHPNDIQRVLATHAKLPGQSLDTTVSNLAHHGLIRVIASVNTCERQNDKSANG